MSIKIKYNVTIDDEVLENEHKRLVNQLWKLIPMRENGEDWHAHLETVIIELSGLVSLLDLYESQEFLILLSKLEGLDVTSYADFFLYRRTVFKCIDLLGRIFKL